MLDAAEVASLYQRTGEQIQQAVTADSGGQPFPALAHYNAALKLIATLLEADHGEKRDALVSKYCEYACRAGELLIQLCDSPGCSKSLRAGNAALVQARSLRSQCSIGESIDAYIEGLGHYQNVLAQSEARANGSNGVSPGGMQGDLARELRAFILLVFSEAEDTKRMKHRGSESSDLIESVPKAVTRSISSPMSSANGSSASARPQQQIQTQEPSQNYELPKARRHSEKSIGLRNTHVGPLAHSISQLSLRPAYSGPPRVRTPMDRLSGDELEVIKCTSHVNGLTFLPWMDNDLGENFALQEYFTDKDGLLRLSAKQQRKLSRWRRAGQIYRSPRVFEEIGCAHIVQETVTDCSFVAAMCVSVEYERRFGKQLITQHIFPQGPTGMPIFNPCGKYMVKLYINGFWRRVIIDDLLPVAEDGKLMCTYSSEGDVGTSLIEKAYLKLMGGYDFPGSNSSTDLHILTGWIPEHVFVHDQAFNSERTWQRMYDASRNGDVLLTIATGEMSNDLAGTLGLVPSHAYAVLDVREVGGNRLIKVKNPWSSVRWTGKFSHTDRTNWTADLMRELCYDPVLAEDNDRGIFWIDFESVCHRFDAIHLNWNPELFLHRAGVHFEWKLSMGPRQALYDFSANPQYTLTVDGAGSNRPLVWLVLSKHVQKTEENRDFIALHVYDSYSGRRVYEPRSAMRIGEYVNSPHVLVQFSATPGTRYTLVVAQREKSKPLYFTLRAFCDAPISLQQAPFPSFEEVVQGQWGSGSAGGNPASPRYLDNPQYKLVVRNNGNPRAKFSGIISLESKQKHPVNVRVFRGGFLVTRVLEINTVANSGKYRPCFCTCSLDSLDEGSYTVVVSTFQQFMFSRFRLTVGLDLPFTLVPIPREGAGMRMRELHGSWTPGTDAAGGPVDPQTIRSPRFVVRTGKPTGVLARLQTPQVNPPPLVNVSIYRFDGGVVGDRVVSSGNYTNSPQGVATHLAEIGRQDELAQYLVAASTWDAADSAPFVLYFYSEDPVEIESLT
ncbi:cysteine protease [Linderina pennispora]|nr:cysteine protease [Linderina pennispora]